MIDDRVKTEEPDEFVNIVGQLFKLADTHKASMSKDQVFIKIGELGYWMAQSAMVTEQAKAKKEKK